MKCNSGTTKSWPGLLFPRCCMHIHLLLQIILQDPPAVGFGLVEVGGVLTCGGCRVRTSKRKVCIVFIHFDTRFKFQQNQIILFI